MATDDDTNNTTGQRNDNNAPFEPELIRPSPANNGTPIDSSASPSCDEEDNTMAGGGGIRTCCGRCLSSWRSWIRQLIMILYLTLFLIMFTSILVGINSFKLGMNRFTSANFLAGLAMAFTIPVSLWGILQHCVNYTNPALQVYIIRILWMVPIYSALSFCGLHYTRSSVILDAIRDCYEAFVVYSFTCFLVKYLQQECPELDYTTKSAKHIFPCCCVPPWKSHESIVNCTIGVLQYTLVNPILTVVTVVTTILGVYNQGEWSFEGPWLYLTFVTNCSQAWALYSLVLFYQTFKVELSRCRPVGKFMCIKLVVFATWWQSVGISLLVQFTMLKNIPWIAEQSNNEAEISNAIQDFVVCFEMLVAAIAHYYAFSHREFKNSHAHNPGIVSAVKQMLDISDVGSDVLTHTTIVRDRVKRKITGKNSDPQDEQFVDINQTEYLVSISEDDTIIPIGGDDAGSSSSRDHCLTQSANGVASNNRKSNHIVAKETSDTNLLI